MLKRELHKVFIKRGLVYFFLVVLVAEAGLIFSRVSRELPTAADRELYFSLVREFSGELTDEKKAALAEEKRLYDEALFAMDDMGQYSKYLSGRTGGWVFFEDADYAVSHGTQIINGCLWRALYPKASPDLLPAAAMLVFVIVSETAENETNVTMLKSTSPYGKKRLYRLDAAIGITLAGLLSLMVSVLRLAAAYRMFGLSGVGLPLESLPVFENSPMPSLSLLQGFLLVCTMSALGLAAYTSLAFMIGRLTGSALTTALISVLAVILPPYVLDAPALYYFSPVSLMQSIGFLYGDIVWEGEQYGGRIVWSTAAGRGSLAFSVCFALILMIAALTTGKRRMEQ